MANDENFESVTADTVGSVLKKARESKGLTASDVADAQHLRTGIIHSIESAEYEQIGSELFLKGYVRAYAVHVGLDPDTVVADLDRELEPLRQKQAQELESSPLVDIERRRLRKRQIAMVLIPVVALALIAILLFAFVFSGDESDAEATAPAAASQQDDLAADDGEPSAVAEKTIFAEEEEAEVAPESEAEAPAAADDASPVTESAATDSASEPLVAATVSEPEIPVAAAPVPAAEPLVQPAVPETVSPVASDVGRLQISFIDDCWVRVTDAFGNRLVNGLKRSGGQVDVTGEPPLKVIIGAVSAVDSIRFQGLPVEITRFPVINNRSEFTLED